MVNHMVTELKISIWSWLVIYLTMDIITDYYRLSMASHWKCTVNLSYQIEDGSVIYWNGLENGLWQTTILSSAVYHDLQMVDETVDTSLVIQHVACRPTEIRWASLKLTEFIPCSNLWLLLFSGNGSICSHNWCFFTVHCRWMPLNINSLHSVFV